MLQAWRLNTREESDLPNITQSLMQQEETDPTSPYSMSRARSPNITFLLP